MSNIEHLAIKKYHDDEDKQKEMMEQVVAALDKEEANYRQQRQTMKRTIHRQTLKRKDLTDDQRNKLQKMDEDYMLFKVSEDNITIDELEMN